MGVSGLTRYWLFATPITTPPATINKPPSSVAVDGGWLKNTHETTWAITKKNTT
jgi:hypothetical protein